MGGDFRMTDNQHVLTSELAEQLSPLTNDIGDLQSTSSELQSAVTALQQGGGGGGSGVPVWG